MIVGKSKAQQMMDRTQQIYMAKPPVPMVKSVLVAPTSSSVPQKRSQSIDHQMFGGTLQAPLNFSGINALDFNKAVGKNIYFNLLRFQAPDSTTCRD
jgi:hypothetical protein